LPGGAPAGGAPAGGGAFVFTVPGGAFDQAVHQPGVTAPGEVDQPVDDEGAALLVSLDHEAQAIPAGQIGIAGQRLEQVERQLQAIALLGIDIEADGVVPGEQRQTFQAR